MIRKRDCFRPRQSVVFQTSGVEGCALSWRALLLILSVLTLVNPFPLSIRGEKSSNTSYVNFNFDQVDLRLLIKLVGDETGKKFVIDEKVVGNVTVVTPPQIARDQMYPLLVSILEFHGYTIVVQDTICHVIPLPKRVIAQAPVLGPNEKITYRGFTTKVTKLNYISARELRKLLEPFVSGGKNGAIAAYEPSNHLVITDTSTNLKRFDKMIRQLDQPGASRLIEIIPLKHAYSEELADQIMAVLLGSEKAGKRISRHVQQVAQGGGAVPGNSVVIPAPHANSLIVSATPVELAEIKEIIKKLDVEPVTGYGRLNVIFLKYLGAEEAAKSLNVLLSKSLGKEKVQRITLEPSIPNNALLVEATPTDFEIVRQLIDKLDQSPKQVLVEVLIAEVSLGNSFDVGIDLATIDVARDGRSTFVGRSRPDQTDFVSTLVSNVIFPQGASLALARGTFVDSLGRTLPRIPVLLRALAEDRDIKILSNIPLMAQNNKPASVLVVENIPVLRSTIEGGSGTARDVIQNIDRVDVGIKFEFTPHINPDNEVLMELHPSIEAVTEQGPQGLFSPVISKREVSTTVTAPDKTTVILSGLIREDHIERVSKIPILGDIPFLGKLFQSTSRRKQRTNLLIFVTPHILDNKEDAEAIKRAIQEKTAIPLPTEPFTLPSTEKE